MNPISKLRFDALAGYSRAPFSPLVASEIAWYEQDAEKLLGVIALAIGDDLGEYVAVVLARDARHRFRAVDVRASISGPGDAERVLNEMLAKALSKPDSSFHQGDETGRPIDFFHPVVDESRFHPSFKTLLESDSYSPALGLMREMMHHFDDRDGNFVEQFQSTGFDARVWELYLYALFVELGYAFVPGHAAPDFHCRGLGGEFFVEATTVNPSDDAPTIDEDNQEAYFSHYAPRKFGSALFSKIQKRYWELPHLAASPWPLLFAVQDFHAPGAMTWSSTALVEYLYGIRQVEREDEEGRRLVVAETISEFQWGSKPPIPAGFFRQPDSEHISAVLANPSGTLVKFNRMGFLAKFGRSDLRMIRSGLCYQGGPLPEQFVVAVERAGYSETWVEGLSVYHNPTAVHPLPPEAVPGAAHHFLRDHKIESVMPTWFPVGSTTAILVATDKQGSHVVE